MSCGAFMRANSGIYVPENLDPGSLGIERQLVVPLCWMTHEVIIQNVFDSRVRDGGGYAPLNAEIQRKIIGRYLHDAVRLAALDKDVLEVACRVGPGGEVIESYHVGFQAKAYRLGDQYRDSPWRLRRWTDLDDWRIAKHVEEWRRSEERQLWLALENGELPRSKSVCKFLWDNLLRISIDDVIEGPLSSATELAVEMIRQGQWRLKPDEYGRIHTNISNLKKEIRGCLSVDGERLANLDITNSQPLFMALTAVNHYHGKEIPQDLKLFLRVCADGRFYEDLQDRLKAAGEDVSRPQVKRLAFTVFFGPSKPRLHKWANHALRDEHRQRLAAISVMREAYPSFMGYADEIKVRNYRLLAHQAQRTESAFIYDIVVAEFERRHPDAFVATIHDSLLVEKDMEEEVRGMMQDAFQKAYGIMPVIKHE